GKTTWRDRQQTAGCAAPLHRRHQPVDAESDRKIYSPARARWGADLLGPGPQSITSAWLLFLACLRSSSSTWARSASNTRRCSPDSATKRLPRARPINVKPAFFANSTPQAVKPERDTSTGMRILTVLITISDVRRPVV